MASRRVAAIDIGTNSIHMIVAELRRGAYRVVDREREMVQLGLGSLDGAPLGENACARAITALSRMAEVARGWKADEIIAVATSAVREAPNRRDFIRSVRDATGIRVRVISGEEEADYIFRAVRSAIGLDGDTALCVDIGGGSVEFIIGGGEGIYFAASEPLGSLRLAQRFELTDYTSSEAIAACRAHAVLHVRRIAKQARSIGVDRLVGTSGTVHALASAAAAGVANGAPPRYLTRDAVSALLDRFAGSNAKDRVKTFGVEDRRATSIVAGAVALAAIMDEVGLDELIACPAAIREGIIESRISERRTPERSRETRVAAVAQFADRSECDGRHAKHVAKLATRIFDQTALLHGLPLDSREVLGYAALLHEVGLHVSDRRYHRHTYYLLRHASLRGFTEEELILIANVARYHRKGEPNDADENLAELTRSQRVDVDKLVAILRIADALDRSHRQAVRDVAVHVNESVTFCVRTRTEASAEISAAAKRSRFFSGLFERKVQFETI